jgi:hypothetical protein
MRRLVCAVVLLAGLATSQTKWEYGWECGTRLTLQGTAYCGLHAGLVAHVHSEAYRPGIYMIGAPLTRWYRLPFSLSASACYIFIRPVWMRTFVLDYKGQHSFAWGFYDCTLVGLRIDQQVVVLMDRAPHWGQTLSTSQAWWFKIQPPK